MKMADIVDGEVYLVKVGSELVAVRVKRLSDWKGRTVWRCTRVDNGRILPKHRTAASIRPKLPCPVKRLEERDALAATARSHGHIALTQGYAVECAKCGADRTASTPALDAPCEVP